MLYTCNTVTAIQVYQPSQLCGLIHCLCKKKKNYEVCFHTFFLLASFFDSYVYGHRHTTWQSCKHVLYQFLFSQPFTLLLPSNTPPTFSEIKGAYFAWLAPQLCFLQILGTGIWSCKIAFWKSAGISRNYWLFHFHFQTGRTVGILQRHLNCTHEGNI